MEFNEFLASCKKSGDSLVEALLQWEQEEHSAFPSSEKYYLEGDAWLDGNTWKQQVSEYCKGDDTSYPVTSLQVTQEKVSSHQDLWDTL